MCRHEIPPSASRWGGEEDDESSRLRREQASNRNLHLFEMDNEGFVGGNERVDFVDEDALTDEDDDDALPDDDHDDEDEIRRRREYREEVIRQVADNEPSLWDTWIGDEDEDGQVYPNDGDWERFGASMGRNTHINEVAISFNTTTMGVQAVHFFQGLAMNRSIVELHVTDVQSSDIFRLLVPFFVNNNSFKTLRVTCKKGGDECISKIAFALGQFNSLTDFTLFYASAYYEGGASCEVIEALAGHSGLKCLSLNNFPIGRDDACIALVDLLRNPQVILESLHLFRTEIYDKGADILSAGLLGNNSLTNLYINGFSEIGWLAIFAMLKNPQCRLSCLDLIHSNINDAVARSLANALRCNSTLKSLFLKDIHSITNSGWRDLFMGILDGPHCILEKLDLRDSRGDDPDSMIESLTSALAGNVNLKELHLFTCGSATPVGWQTLASILRNPSSVLEILDLEDNSINDDIMSEFAMALANNTKLKIFFIVNIRGVTSISHDALSRLLCDTSTILNTFNSNHTLESIGFVLREDFSALHRINRNNSIRQAARIKILNSHFSGSDINTQVFTDMTSNILPTAMSWMGHDNGSNGGRNLMFEFLRRAPLICDTKSVSKKRKASIDLKSFTSERHK